MKPQFERVTFPEGCSLRVYNRRVLEIPFEWHHHPEYELTLTLNSRGWRFIGDHIGQYQAPDLVLVPPDMPTRGLPQRPSSKLNRTLQS
jgi:hypothetical protein